MLENMLPIFLARALRGGRGRAGGRRRAVGDPQAGVPGAGAQDCGRRRAPVSRGRGGAGGARGARGGRARAGAPGRAGHGGERRLLGENQNKD